MFKLQFKDNPGRSIWLVGEKITLGSHKDNTMVLDGLGIEEFHAELFIEPNYLILKSKPGTCIVNDLPVDGEFRLNANDELRIGKERLLIIDPKNPPPPKKRPGAAKARAGQPRADWALVPDHAKLAQLDFSITDKAILGRARECRFSVPYKLLSREHAELRLEDGALYLRDLDSANGCFVNGNRVREARLQNGDKVAFAKLSFTVRGPESGSDKSQTRAAGDEELNRTMIRPAISVDDIAQQAAADSLTQGGSLHLEASQKAGSGSGDSGAERSSLTLVVALAVAVAVVAGVAWYFLMMK